MIKYNSHHKHEGDSQPSLQSHKNIYQYHSCCLCLSLWLFFSFFFLLL